MGYCFGGAAALELARSEKAEHIAGYVSFHGGLATPEDQAYPSETPPILIAHGGADTSVTMDEVVDLARQRRAPVSRMKFRSILARRSFTEFGSERYQKRADKQSWDAFSKFLATNLAD